MKDLKGTKTEANLMAAFAGESQARNKYTYYASKAKKEGYEQIAALFLETANNEKEHAKIWFKLLHGGEMPDTMANLKDAADGENYEWTDMSQMSGIEILDQIKETSFLKKMPVVMMTAYGDFDNETKVIELGASEVVNLPVNVTLLKKRIENIINISNANKYLHAAFIGS